MDIKVLALDLEATLISDAITVVSRPGLFDFLAYCHERFGRVALFTAVETPDAREVMDELLGRGDAPAALIDRLEYVEWRGEHKDLRFVRDAKPEEVWLVDDDEEWIAPDQRDRWIPIQAWMGEPDDRELERIKIELEQRLS